jgi:uncharacterized protein with PIN domain
MPHSPRYVSITPLVVMEAKDCPMCGTTMRLKTRQMTDRVPGTRQSNTKAVTEWTCPECDYFEEVEES